MHGQELLMHIYVSKEGKGGLVDVPGETLQSSEDSRSALRHLSTRMWAAATQDG